MSGCVLAVATSLVWSGAAQAQAQPTSVSDSPEVEAAADAGEIIVTAQKRAESIQDVPLSVQVLGSEQLTAAGVREFTDLTRVAPSLVIRPAEHPQNAAISLRGVGTFAFSIGVEPSVAIQVDDAPLAFQARAFTDLPDVERIEVLRGPQSTLYGKSASAGLINIVTKAPTKDFTGTINAIGTTDEEYGVNFSIAGPVRENLGYRVSGSYTSFDGNILNVANGKELNGREVLSLRGKLLWEPTDTLRVHLIGNYIDGKTTFGRPFTRLSPNARLRGDPTLPVSAFLPSDITVGPKNRRVSYDTRTGTEYKGGGAILKAELELGDHTLVSISSYDKFELDDNLDQDETAIAAYRNVQVGTFNSEQTTQEFRLLSPGDQPFRYTLGAFYADVQFERPFFRGPVFALANWFATSSSKQLAAFGQLEWEFIEGTTAIGGLRGQNEKVDYSFRDIQNNNAFFSGDAEDSVVTYRLGLRQEFNRDIMAFINFATGYKGQTYDLTTGFNAVRAAVGAIRPETSESVELGLRTQFLDRRLTLNITYFDATYKDLQAQTVELLPDGTSNFRLTNVGRTATRGVEIEAAARLRDDLNISAAVAYLDAKFQDFPVAQCFPGQTAAQGCVSPGPGQPSRQSLTGARPAQAPKWKIVGLFDYSPDLGSLPFKGLLQAAWTYQSAINYSFNGDPEGAQPGYHIVNLNVGVREPDRRYEVVLFVNNLFDEQYNANFGNSRGGFGNQAATTSVIPRNFRRYGGIRASVGF